jgi:hypothetical protein
VTIALAYVVSALLTTGLLWTISWLRGLGTPLVDLCIIAGLCAGLALLPGWGWALGTIFMTLLVLKTTDADVWPDAVVIVLASNVIWAVTYVVAFTS